MTFEADGITPQETVSSWEQQYTLSFKSKC